MTSIVELFPKCRKLAYDCRQQLSQVQNGLLPVSDLNFVLEELSRQLDLMEQLVLRETPQQREVWKRKILELREEHRKIQKQTEVLDHRQYQTSSYQQQRNELLTRRRPQGGVAESDLQNLAEESRSWQQSQYMVNDLIANGEAQLSNLVEQRQRLGGVGRFLGQIDDRLGISNTTMKVIERRDITDAYYVFGGCVFTCIVIYFVWF